jgi:hypothetical protein
MPDIGGLDWPGDDDDCSTPFVYMGDNATGKFLR